MTRGKNHKIPGKKARQAISLKRLDRSSPYTIINDFVSVNSTEQASALIKRMEARGLEGCLRAGDVCLEVAMSFEDISDNQAIAMFGRARDNWNKAALTHDIRARQNSYILRAQVQLAHLPLYATLRLEKQIPTFDHIESAYNKMLQNIPAICQEYEGRQSGVLQIHPSYIQEEGKLIGMISELSILLLLHRWRLGQGPASEQNWLATPSLISEDRFGVSKQRGAIRDTWDISVWGISDDMAPFVTSRIQATTSTGTRRKKNYDYHSSITDIALDECFNIGQSARLWPLETVLLDCVRERKGDTEAVERLDWMTARLHEKLAE